MLSLNLMTLRNLRYACTIDTNRHNNLKFVVVMPKASPLRPKNFATHRRPRLRDVANDVLSDVS